MKFHRSSGCIVRGRYAYSLAEVLVAVLLVGLLTISLYAGFSSGFGTMQSARENLRATQVMVKKLEAVRLIKWSELRNVSFQERYDPFGAATNGEGLLYTGTLTTNAATAIPDGTTYKPDMRLVTVRIFWTNQFGPKQITHSREMETYVARYGMQNYIFGANTVTTPNANPPGGDGEDDRHTTGDYGQDDDHDLDQD
jgi:type II secretory pathway pseudopilin PulG